MDRAATLRALEQLFADFDRVWVYRIYDTVTDPDGLIRRWLQEHGTLFEERVFGGESQLRVQGYLTGRDPEVAVAASADAALADGSLRLAGSLDWPSSVAAGGTLDLAPVWSVGALPGEDWILFAGLFDETGIRWAQTDERASGSLYPPQAWPTGAMVRTPLRLAVPPGTPPGRYRLELGWYRFVDGQPVWVPWLAGERLVLGKVSVRPPRTGGPLRRRR
jgi:hypothetical protein